MKKLIVALFLLFAVAAHAETPTDIYSVDGKNFDSKTAAIRYIVSSGSRKQVLNTRCLILTNKFTFKACPKNKAGSFDNEQFAGLKNQ